jgi:hypothetical protein
MPIICCRICTTICHSVCCRLSVRYDYDAPHAHYERIQTGDYFYGVLVLNIAKRTSSEEYDTGTGNGQAHTWTWHFLTMTMTTLTTMSAADPLRQPSLHLIVPQLEEPTNSRSPSESSFDYKGVSFESLNVTELIDNSTRQYNTVRLACGVTVHVGENVLQSCPGVLDILNNDVLGCISVLPGSTHKLVRRTKIWINHR